MLSSGRKFQVKFDSLTTDVHTKHFFTWFGLFFGMFDRSPIPSHTVNVLFPSFFS